MIGAFLAETAHAPRTGRATQSAPRSDSAATLALTVTQAAALRPCGTIVLLVGALARRGVSTETVRAALADYTMGDPMQTVAAITQRISRETDAVSAKMEVLAKALCAAISAGAFDTVRIDEADHVDSASLRVLARCSFRLARRGIGLQLRLRHPLPELTDPDPRAHALGHAWANVRAACGDTMLVETGTFAAIEYPAYRFTDFDHFQLRLAAALRTLAFELALKACSDFAAGTADRDAIAEALRIEATIHCNLGDNDAAEGRLAEAMATAVSPCPRSRILYTLGLIVAKRRGDVTRARTIFLAGQDLLSDAALAETSEARLCLAWHDNGLGLLSAMEAKSGPAEQRSASLAAAAQHERNALARIAELVEGGALYLRYNLRANLVLLIEMSGNAAVARDLLERSFARFTRSDDNARLWMTYDYRLGALSAKAGAWDEAATSLRSALEAGRVCRAEQSVTRIAIALAGVLATQGELGAASCLLVEAQADAEERRDDQAMASVVLVIRDHVRLPNVELAGVGTAAASYLARCGVNALPAATAWLPAKLPSYCSFIDLLDEGQGTNARLTDSGGGRR